MATLRSQLTSYIDSLPANSIAVSVRDVASHTTFDISGDRIFHAASTMKILVMMELFHQAAEGLLSVDDSVVVQNEFTSIADGSQFSITVDVDDDLHTRLYQSMTLRDLNYSMITASSNLATNLLIDKLGTPNVQRFADSKGVEHTRVLRGVEDVKAFESGLSNTTTSADLALILSTLMTHTCVSLQADSEMIKVMLDQRFNSMIPGGLPHGTKVAHKTGWITQIFHDAAIVYPTDAEPYVIVILTEGFNKQNDAEKAIRHITNLVHSHIRPTV